MKRYGTSKTYINKLEMMQSIIETNGNFTMEVDSLHNGVSQTHIFPDKYSPL